MGTTAKLKLKKGDQVVVLTGRSKGEVARLTKLILFTQRAFVSGANIYKKHQKVQLATKKAGLLRSQCHYTLAILLF